VATAIEAEDAAPGAAPEFPPPSPPADSGTASGNGAGESASECEPQMSPADSGAASGEGAPDAAPESAPLSPPGKGLVLSFSQTVEGILSGEQQVTRRQWSPAYARKWVKAYDEGKVVHQAWDKPPFAGGKFLRSIRLTCRPYQEKLAEMPVEDVKKECVPGVRSKQEFLSLPLFKGCEEVWVIRFEVLPAGDACEATLKAENPSQSEGGGVGEGVSLTSPPEESCWVETYSPAGSAHGRHKYFRFAWKQGGFRQVRHIPGGNCFSRVAKERAATVEGWILACLPPMEIQAGIRAWGRGSSGARNSARSQASV
jgi:hypothetical protein